MSNTIEVKRNGSVRKVKEAPVWKIAARTLSRLEPKPGFLITRAWLLEQFGMIEPGTWTRQTWETFQFAWLHNMESFRAHLLEDYRIDLRKVPLKGYEIINPKEQTRTAMREGLNEIAKILNRTTQRVLYVDHKKLNEREKKENLQALAKLGMIRTAFTKHRRLSHKCYRMLDTKLKKAGYELPSEHEGS